jgi:hypothetical protein
VAPIVQAIADLVPFVQLRHENLRVLANSRRAVPTVRSGKQFQFSRFSSGAKRICS